MTTAVTAPLEQRTVAHVLRKGATEHPDRVAIRDEDGEVTYAELLDRSARAAAGLRELGVGPGDNVLLMLENSVDHAVCWFGTSCAGAVSVPLNTAYQTPQLVYVANHSEARVMVIDAEHVQRLLPAARELTHLEHVIVRHGAGGRGAANGQPGAEAAGGQPGAELSGAAGEEADGPLPFTVHDLGLVRQAEPGAIADLAPWDPSGIMYTSGTTGEPKGVVVTHAQTYGRMLPLGPGSPQAGDISLVTLPIHHVIGQCRGLYNTLIAGGATVLQRRFSASRFWDACRKHGVTYVPLVGVMATYLLRQPPRPDDTDHGVLRICLGTTIAQVDEFRERFAVPDVHVSYGMTEAGGVMIGPAEATGCGWLRDDFEGRLVDEHDMEVPPGEVGELLLRPKEPWTVMAGYYKRPAETAEKWRNLWLHTGDLMRRRDDGNHIFVDRRAERIRHKGENVSPGEVEQQILAHPAVAECAVVGLSVSDLASGEAASSTGEVSTGEQEILAVVVCAAGAAVEPAQLIEFLATRLPHFALPRYVRLVNELPRTDSTRRVRKGLLIEQGAAGAWDRGRAR